VVGPLKQTLRKSITQDATHDDTLIQEIATVTLANEILPLSSCDEFNRLSPIHASLIDT